MHVKAPELAETKDVVMTAMSRCARQSAKSTHCRITPISQLFEWGHGYLCASLKVLSSRHPRPQNLEITNASWGICFECLLIPGRIIRRVWGCSQCQCPSMSFAELSSIDATSVQPTTTMASAGCSHVYPAPCGSPLCCRLMA